jgi:hypothetical protein
MMMMDDFEALKLCVFQMADAFTALDLLALPAGHSRTNTTIDRLMTDDDWMLLDDAG